MVEKIIEPDIDKATTDGWVNFINRTKAQGVGFISLGLTNIDTLDVPKISAVSRFEFGGAFYKCTSDETIDNASSAAGRYFVYAFFAGPTPAFVARLQDTINFPAWNSEKGGWYNASPQTNERAVATFNYNGNGQYQNKIILDSFNSMNNPMIKIPEWQRGFLRLNLSHLDDGQEPEILKGSLIEVDGVLFQIDDNIGITISETNTYQDGFIFARYYQGQFGLTLVPDSDSVRWNIEKQGWYSAGGIPLRAIVKLFFNKNTNYYHGKMILDSFSAMSTIRNDIKPLMANQGMLIIDDSTPLACETVTTKIGMYHFDIRGASSGILNNSNGRNSGEPNAGSFIWTGSEISYGVGQNGIDGVSPAYNAGEGGLSFIGSIIAKGGEKAGSGSYANWIHGGGSNTTGYVKLWRDW